MQLMCFCVYIAEYVIYEQLAKLGKGAGCYKQNFSKISIVRNILEV